MHFESRYQSINQLLEELTATNILEISSGFSFRGLDLSRKKNVFYIDTDLPDIVAGKQHFIDALAAPAAAPTGHAPAPGHYELCPLNALDPAAFDEVVKKFPPGPLTIINEGLLVYLDAKEKAQLCANIRRALLTRSGYWITGDIYLKRQQDDEEKNAAWRQWSREHNLEEKKFASFGEAENFFHDNGFEKEKEATQDYPRLTSFPQFLKAAGTRTLNELRRTGRPRQHATWRLVPKP
jgi:O-methyltransferase involved in polyketide biosynthesis